MTAQTQLVLWIAHPVLQLAVGVAMLRRKLHKTFPVFFSYICFQILSFCVLFPLNTWGSYETHLRDLLLSLLGMLGDQAWFWVS